MLDLIHLMNASGQAVVFIPAVLVAALGLPTLLGFRLPEGLITRLVNLAMVAGLVASSVVLVAMLATGERNVRIDLGDWVAVGEHIASKSNPTLPEQEAFHFAFKFKFDRLSVPFAILTFLLCGVISTFASRYLHREAGFNRFFLLLALFAVGMVLTTLAGTIETLFTGWEFVGISSALLVAFFHERRGPVENGLRVWSVYRLSDAALLLAAVALHRLRGSGDFNLLLGDGSWPQGEIPITQSQALLVGGLLLVAAAGKSALIPFSGWLPRAMEGPTPSSAIFYGALSVHLGAFLLLRVSPILECSFVLSAAVVLLGLATAVYASLASRAQSDIKSALSFASLTQVGLIVAEIGLGLRYIALIHILGHACLRTLQFLRAPTLLHDYHSLENALGSHLPGDEGPFPSLLSPKTRNWLYRMALHRGYLDVFLADYIARPILRMFRACDALERRWTDFLTAGPSRESDVLAAGDGPLKEAR
jgi:NADH:ubiquinone oxidoreductase subunit 5 (chain L)/Multisubunit Na+/H+ antiporter, MnhA subunit